MKTDLKHGLLTDQILGVFYDVYNELGHGFGVCVSPVVRVGVGLGGT
jgi:hypothetical protein